MSRRSALLAGALALVLGGAAGWVDRHDDDSSAAPDGARAPTTAAPTTAAPVVIAEIGEIDAGIVTLGRRVIETTGEADLGALLSQLPSGDGDPIERAAGLVRDDFANHRTVVVDGWVLSASEARAAAIVALLCDDVSC